MAWVTLPGVHQDCHGRFYRVAVNSRGRQDLVYIKPEADAPLARMIPVPPEPVRKEKPLVTTDDGTGTKRNVVHLPKRKCVCEFRYKKTTELRKTERDSFARFEEALALDSLHAMCDLDSLHAMCDWHVFYHVEVK